MSKIKTVLFDLGNVLAHIDFNAFWHDLGFFHEKEIAPFKDGYTELTLQYETGYISTDDYLNGLRIVFNHTFTIVQLEQAFSSIIQLPMEGMTDIVKRVSINHQTALVSNTNEIHYKLSLTKFEELKILQNHYLSYQLHVMKPAHGFYNAIIKDQGIPPSHMLFIDDLTENIRAAKTAELQALRFENTGQLETELQNLGVL